MPDLDDEKAKTRGAAKMRTAIKDRYKGIFRRVAYRLHGPPDRTIDVVIGEGSGSGKTTLVALIEAAIPGGTQQLSGKNAVGPNAHRFDGLKYKLCSGAFLTVVDEIEKGPNGTPLIIDGSTITAATHERPDVEEKGKMVRQMRRTASLMLIGADWPHIDSDEQGVANRFTWAMRLDPSYGPMDWEERELLFSDDGIRCLRATLFRMAHEHHEKGGDIEFKSRTDASNACLDEFIEARRNPHVKALRESFVESIHGRVERDIVAKVVDETSKAMGEKGPQGRAFGAVVKRAFPCAKSKVSNSTGYWYGFYERNAYEPRPARIARIAPVSYTHLTLPTICSV